MYDLEEENRKKCATSCKKLDRNIRFGVRI